MFGVATISAHWLRMPLDMLVCALRVTPVTRMI
jgi:hypothetical protein